MITILKKNNALSAVFHFLNFHKHFIFSPTQDTTACFMDANSDAIPWRFTPTPGGG